MKRRRRISGSSSTCRGTRPRISPASSGCSRSSARKKPSARSPAPVSRPIAIRATPSPRTTWPLMSDAPVDSKVPVLTEVVAEVRRARPAVDAATLEALARELERAVLARLGPEVDRVIEERLARTLSLVLGQALDGVRSELTAGVTQMVREAVAASVAHALALPEANNK